MKYSKPERYGEKFQKYKTNVYSFFLYERIQREKKNTTTMNKQKKKTNPFIFFQYFSQTTFPQRVVRCTSN